MYLCNNQCKVNNCGKLLLGVLLRAYGAFLKQVNQSRRLNPCQQNSLGGHIF